MGINTQYGYQIRRFNGHVREYFSQSNYLIPLEPIGAKAPTFQGDSKGSIYWKSSGQDIVLLCQAQAYPVPLIR